MSKATTIQDFLKSLPTNNANYMALTVDSAGNPAKISHRRLADIAFSTVNSAEDLDNPSTKGIFTVNPTTVITRPTKGTGWTFGYVLNLAIATGVQIWFNFDGYIAVRGKGSADSDWSDWSVMPKM